MAADAQGPEHRGGAGVEGNGRGVWCSHSGAWVAVGFLDKAHKQNPLVRSVLDLLLETERENARERAREKERSG